MFTRAAPGFDALAPLRARSRRVFILVSAVAILSLIDLLLTITLAEGGGMNESNPIARLLLEHGGRSAIVPWKLLTTGLACGILLRCRNALAAEIGAWIAFGVLCWLSLHWGEYLAYYAAAVDSAQYEFPECPETWVTAYVDVP